jgi:hypothetical protein
MEVMMKIVVLLGKVLLIFVGGVVVLGVGTYFMAQALPQVTVQNHCEQAILLPTGVQLIPGIPAQIDVDGEATFPVVIGPGQYRLYEEGSSLYVQLPRAIPSVGDTIRISQSFSEPEASFNGQPVTVPMVGELKMNETYTAEICN